MKKRYTVRTMHIGSNEFIVPVTAMGNSHQEAAEARLRLQSDASQNETVALLVRAEGSKTPFLFNVEQPKRVRPKVVPAA